MTHAMLDSTVHLAKFSCIVFEYGHLVSLAFTFSTYIESLLSIMMTMVSRVCHACFLCLLLWGPLCVSACLLPGCLRTTYVRQCPKLGGKGQNECPKNGSSWLLPDTLPDTIGGQADRINLAPKFSHNGGLELLASRVRILV
jgi:hypothetical protein